ncbi:MAG: amidohydrolase, partial [Proteobacteria bacterium]|nr:amidohydrolase [Pseudomonadota bacterium]
MTNGHVRTLNPSQPLAEAVAVKGDRIVYVGTNSGAEALRGPGTRMIDLGARTLLPGLADAHVHPLEGEFLHRRLCNVRGFSAEEGLRNLRHCAETAPAGDWVVGYGWYDLDNADFDTLTRAQLGSVAPERKVAVISRDHHTVWVNPRVLSSFGIDDNTPSPPGGEIIRDPMTHQPTGMLIDSAWAPVVDEIEHRSAYAAPAKDLLRSSLQHLNTFGITSIVDALADEDRLRAYIELDRAGELTARVTVAMPVSPANFRTEIPLIAERQRTLRSENVRVGFIKVFADGNPEVGLSSLLTHDGSSAGKTPGYYTDEQFRELVNLSEKFGVPIFVHVIGDGATRQALDAIENARRSRPKISLRHTLTHLCWVDTQDMPRFRRLGVIANLQEGWLAPAAFGGPPGYDYARSTAAGAIGPWLAGRVTPYRDIVDAGAAIASGSDWFYTDENPWSDLEAGATSMDPGGTNHQPMIPNYTVDVARLLAARTTGSAYQVGQEDDLGMIRPGYKADLVATDRDPLTVPAQTLHDMRVDFTVF